MNIDAIVKLSKAFKRVIREDDYRPSDVLAAAQSIVSDMHLSMIKISLKHGVVDKETAIKSVDEANAGYRELMVKEIEKL